MGPTGEIDCSSMFRVAETSPLVGLVDRFLAVIAICPEPFKVLMLMFCVTISTKRFTTCSMLALALPMVNLRVALSLACSLGSISAMVSVWYVVQMSTP